MYCMSCGGQLPDGARFCRYCGAPQTDDAMGGQQVYRQPVYPQQPSYSQPQTGKRQTGALLLEAGKVSRYSGDKGIGTITGTGDLTVYDDRLEFLKKSGDQSGYMFGPIIGAAMAMNDAKKNPVDVYRFRDIKSVRKGKYAGMKETLILELSNGKSVSFVPASKKSDPDVLCSLIDPYL